MLPVKMRCRLEREVELGAVRAGSFIGHCDDAPAIVLRGALEVIFISERSAPV